MSRPHPEDPHFRLLAREERSFPCVVGKEFPAFPSHLKRRHSLRERREELQGHAPIHRVLQMCKSLKGNLFSLHCFDFQARVDSHHCATWDSTVGKPRGKASWEILVGKPRGKASRESHRSSGLLLGFKNGLPYWEGGAPCHQLFWIGLYLILSCQPHNCIPSCGVPVPPRARQDPSGLASPFSPCLGVRTR